MQCAKIFYFSVTLRFSVTFPIPFTVREELNFRKKEAVFEKKRHEFWEIKDIPCFQPPHRKSINFNIFSPYTFRCQIIVLRAACTIRGKKSLFVTNIQSKHSVYAVYTVNISHWKLVYSSDARVVTGERTYYVCLNVETKYKRMVLANSSSPD